MAETFDYISVTTEGGTTQYKVPPLAAEFDPSSSYTAGNYCTYQGKLYLFTSNHTGAWNASHVTEASLSSEVAELKSQFEYGCITADLKAALLQLAQNVAYVNADGQDYYDDLYAALYYRWWAVTNTLSHCTSSNGAEQTIKGNPYTATITAATGYTLTGATVSVTMGGVDVTSTYYSNGVISIPAVTGALVITITAAAVAVSSIDATFTQGSTVVYTNDSLDSLKSMLVVTATLSDSSEITVPSTDYTLSGTLAEGTQTITVTFASKTDTFTVSCTVKGWLYHFNQSLASSGSEDFSLTGSEVYAAGRLGTDYAYSHMIPTPGDYSTDTQYGLKSTGITRFPDFNGDFTISYWFSAQASTGYMHPFYFTIWVNDNSPSANLASSVSYVWTKKSDGINSNKTAGVAIQGAASGYLLIRVSKGDLSAATSININIPSGFDPTAWHHYALVKKDSTLTFYVDGAAAFTATLSATTVYKANQLSLIDNFGQNSANKSNLNQITYGGKMQDFYVAEFAKWTEAFDASAITY